MRNRITEELKSLFNNTYGISEKKLNKKLWSLVFIVLGIFIIIIKKNLNDISSFDNGYPQTFNKLVICWFITTVSFILLTIFSFNLFQSPIKRNEKNIYKYFKKIFLGFTLTITTILLSPGFLIKLIVDTISNKSKINYLKHLEINLLVIGITLITLMFLIVIIPVSFLKIWLLLSTKFIHLKSLTFINIKTLIYLSTFTIALILRKIIGFTYKKLIKRELKITNISYNSDNYNEYYEQTMLERYTKEIFITGLFITLIFTFILKALDFSKDIYTSHVIDSIFYTISIFTLATTINQQRDKLDKNK